MTAQRLRALKRSTLTRSNLGPWAFVSNRRENETTAGIAAALEVCDVGTAVAIQAALLVNSPAPLRARWSSTRLRPRALSSPHAPDLVLVDDADRCVVVVEHKRGARANATSAATVRGSARFADAAAQAYQLTGSDTAHPHPGGYATSGCPLGCGWHTQRALGNAALTRAGISQADAYRYFTAWVDRANLAAPIALTNPAQVAWVLLDDLGRSPQVALLDPVSGPDWDTVGYRDFIPAVEKALSGAHAGSAQPVQDLLRMLCT